MDLIERQAAIDAIKTSRCLVNALKKTMKLPSAQPERKTAHWKTHIFDGIMGGRPRAYMCGCCNFISLAQTNYCPHCGAKMEVEHEA